MSTFRCKMCGGTLEFTSGSTIAECEYCGAKQTLPKLDDEKRVNYMTVQIISAEITSLIRQPTYMNKY